MVRYCCPNALIETLKSETEFWSGSRTVSELKAGKYFLRSSKQANADNDDDDMVSCGCTALALLADWVLVLR